MVANIIIGFAVLAVLGIKFPAIMERIARM